ncbi:MAG TPA: D-alanyl-D-alanine carboxypeptidase/D-alanyl-D-alanine-endopeptidase [Verrucomicrobiae bacterium]|nr:D-alanyl-D-alanine carboxypeptidase/D-alanyl-D-alanine-endopeptidase [Verrucomicrobiae bacterium]
MVALTFSAAGGICAEAPAPPVTLADLQQQLSNHVSHPRFAAATWGVKVVSLESDKTLFEHNAGKLFSPASNCKLYTVALALDELGGDYRIRTSLYAVSKPDRDGVLKGDLIVYGRGDPTINARLNGGDIFRALQPLVAALTNAGVKRIEGDLIGDESFIHGPPYGSGWSWDDMNYYYGAEISALTLNDNTIQVVAKPGASNGAPVQLTLVPPTSYVILSNRTQTVTSGRRNVNFYRPIEENIVYVTGQMPLDATNYSDDITMHNPAGMFVAFFREALTRNGVKVSGKTRTVNWLDREVQPLDPDKLIELGAVESLPMRDIAREVQKPSQNLYTDLLLAHLGALAQSEVKASNVASARSGGKSSATKAQSKSLGDGAPPVNLPELGRQETSEDAGIRQLREFLAKAGVARGDFHFEEGSGLSRNNLTTPNATAALLQFMSKHTEADTYLKALPIAGVDGTLRNRMKGTPAAGNVRAKTGTLRWANSLSGYVTTAAGERLIFSIMLNRYSASDTEHSARGEIDKIAVMLAGYSGRIEATR